MWRNMFLAAVLLSFFGVSNAQVSFNGKVVSEDEEPIAEGVLSLFQGKELAGLVLTNKMGEFFIGGVAKGEYQIEINALGYEQLTDTVKIEGSKTPFLFKLKRSKESMLDELVVTGSRVKQTATGEVFFLSEKAKMGKNPFVALMEIPRLNVNPALGDVKMKDGTRPMILIDGKPINTGINPILPEDIASVEVIEVISARYLQSGVQNILNIKLKKNRKPYQFLQFATRSDLLPGYGMGVGYFEVGNTKLSLFGRSSISGILNRKTDLNQWQEAEGFRKENNGSNLENNKSFLAELILKWQASKRDYLAATFFWNGKTTRNKREGYGILKNNGEESSFSSLYHQTDESGILTGGLYYHHIFEDASKLELQYGYNKNTNKLDGNWKEVYTHTPVIENLFKYDNSRSSMNLEANYTRNWNDVNSLNIGSNSRFINDKIEQVTTQVPLFKHQRFDEYLFASFSSKVGNLRYMLSGGIEGIWLLAGGEKNSYLRPRISLSGNYSINQSSALRLSYQLTNSTPSVRQLNPYNTSVDPLVITQGNPKLTPEQIQEIRLRYALSLGDWYLLPIVTTYQRTSERIVPHAYNKGGKLVNSYQNQGKFEYLTLGTSFSFTFKDGQSNLYCNIGYDWVFYQNQPVKQTPRIDGGLWLYFGKLMYGLDFNWQPYAYTAQSKTKYSSALNAQMQLNYNITPDFYVAIALQNFAGAQTWETWTTADRFKTYSWNKETSLGFRPWLLLRYTLRKHNTKQRIRNNRAYFSSEEGIKL